MRDKNHLTVIIWSWAWLEPTKPCENLGSTEKFDFENIFWHLSWRRWSAWLCNVRGEVMEGWLQETDRWEPSWSQYLFYIFIAPRLRIISLFLPANRLGPVVFPENYHFKPDNYCCYHLSATLIQVLPFRWSDSQQYIFRVLRWHIQPIRSNHWSWSTAAVSPQLRW